MLTGVLLHTYTVNPDPVQAIHHEAVHVLHVPEPDYSTEPADPNVNRAPGVSGVNPHGNERWQLPDL